MENKMETTMIYWGHIRVILRLWPDDHVSHNLNSLKGVTIRDYIGDYYKGLLHGYIGIMENKMETTIIYWGHIRVMLRLYWDVR